MKLVSSLFFAGALACIGVGAAEAQTVTSRTSDYTVSFSNLTFSDASALYSLSYAFPDQAAFSSNYTLTTLANAGTPTFQDSGGITVTPPSPLGSAPYLLTIDNGSGGAGSGGSWGASYTSAVSTGGDVLTLGTQGGLTTLNFDGGGSVSGYNPLGYYIYVHLPGDWTTSGTATGDYEFNSIDPGFGAPTFSYDAGTNMTTVAAYDPTYQSGEATNLDFTLFGTPSAVPEPAAWALMLTGLGGMGVALRARRKRAVATV